MEDKISRLIDYLDIIPLNEKKLVGLVLNYFPLKIKSMLAKDLTLTYHSRLLEKLV